MDDSVTMQIRFDEGSVIQFTPASGFIVDICWSEKGKPGDLISFPLIGWAVVATARDTRASLTSSTQLAAVFVGEDGTVETTYDEVMASRGSDMRVSWTVRPGSFEEAGGVTLNLPGS